MLITSLSVDVTRESINEFSHNSSDHQCVKDRISTKSGTILNSKIHDLKKFYYLKISKLGRAIEFIFFATNEQLTASI